MSNRLQRYPRRRLGVALGLAVMTAGAAAAGASATAPPTSEPASSEPASSEPASTGAAAAAEPDWEARCAANQEAGTITFLTGFQYAPAVAIADIVTAEAMGFYDELCLDVNIEVSSPATAAPIVASNRAQFASASSATFDAQMVSQGADIVIVLSMAKTNSSVMIVPEGGIESVEEIAGGILGVSGTITGDVAAMLAVNGVDPADLRTVDKGFDARIITSGQMDAMIGFKSNEPYQLDQASIPYTVFDPADYGVTGSFGNMMASRTFVEEHPTATEDFVRATLRGFYYAAENPEEAVGFCEELTEGSFDFDAGLYRWTTEARLVQESTPEDVPIGTHIPELWEDEVGTAIELGVVEGEDLDIHSIYTNEFVDAVYDDAGELIWPE
jgi:putative hydroxymethylpyrimidine transport system substrate-binding protein